MVRLISAISTLDNSIFVSVENSLIWLNTNRNWLLTNSKKHLSFVTTWNISETVNITNAFGFVIRTSWNSSRTRDILVVSLKLNRIFLSVFVNYIEGTSIAGITCSITRNELLLRKWSKIRTITDDTQGFDRTCSRKRPAGSTTSLVFNWGDCNNFFGI